ncbi:hypothetical protein ACFOZ0_08710 [Streptomyces yaanensis]|uniref:Secreted protein n=1 Tax=Streptomyces yaanensis TaxID=1142239 RepID=A0ABV7SAR2_9ACTN|nr:hypothetical protein [Streptomyces sp. CGMCC 4.7035]WNC02834.1 hypothetical protein Q2K21_34970 [Streptomyces sp. CGMCC 4.7035]
MTLVSPSPHAPRTTCRHAWLRVLVVLVALLAAGAHTEAVAAESGAVSAAQSCGAEHDILDTALRPGVPPGHRVAAPLRPAPRRDAGPSAPAGFPPALARAPHCPALHSLRTVVLRC